MKDLWNGLFFKLDLFECTLFYKQHFYKQHQTEIGKKSKQVLSNTLRLNLLFEYYIHSSSTLSSKTKSTYSKK